MQTEFAKRLLDSIAKNYTLCGLKAEYYRVSQLDQEDNILLFRIEEELSSGVNMDTLIAILEKHGIKVIQDLRQDQEGKQFFVIRLIYGKSPFRVISAKYSISKLNESKK